MRKPHKKSRLGCQTCKRRKIKCDEVKPQCGKCIQFGVWCDFSPQPPRPHASPYPRSESQPRGPGRPRSDWESWAEQIQCHAAESAIERSEHLNTMDLELFHNYMTKTANTLHDGTQPHLWSEGPSPGNILLTNIEGHVSWLHLLRGVRSVVEVAGWSGIFSGVLAEYAPIPSGDITEDSTATDTALMVEGIEDWRSSLTDISHAINGTTEGKLKNAYEHELGALKSCFERTFGRRKNAALDAVGKLEDVIGWIYRLEDDYMEGLRQRDLIPMVILGHF
ncbi:unnamed protein product, partial [Fusarium graminearum]